jgi:hypothetical protein
MTDQTDDLKRTIVLIYGLLDNGGPFWLFAAVKPSKYQSFQEAYKEGHLNIHKFEPYGEIIVSGEGKGPPDNVTLKVAEMYQTSSDTLMKSMIDEPAPKK